MGLIFDTSVFIAAERASRSLFNVVTAFPVHEELGISVMTVAELQHGIRRAETPAQLQKRQRLFDDALAILKIYPLTASIAVRVGNLDAELAMRGQRTEIPDIIIGATALELDFCLVTSNIRHFNRIPGITIVQQ